MKDLIRHRFLSVSTLASVLFLIFASQSVFGQNDPYGTVDTISVEDVQAAPGERIEVGVYLFNDEALMSLTVPLNFNNEVLVLDTIRHDGSRIEYLSTKPFSIDNDAGTALIGGVVITEDAIPPGSGLLATLIFDVSPAAEIGGSHIFDSVFIPPAGYMLLVPQDYPKFTPAFSRGHLTIIDPNKPPVFGEIDQQVVFEGDTLRFTVRAVDPDGDGISYSTTRLPSGASFDETAGEFVWVPPYSGPNSSVNSPITVTFSASDGKISGFEEVEIVVLNQNRAPSIAIPDSMDFTVGDAVHLVISASDPDLETVEVDLDGLPTGADYERGNPGYLNWMTTLADSGTYMLNATAVDPFGALTQKSLKLNVHSAEPCEISISDEQVVSGETGIVEVDLVNRLAVSGMNLLIKYDPTALMLLSVSAEGTRTDSWATMIPTINQADGRVWIDGRANLPGHDENPPMQIGDGPVAKLNFLITSDLAFAGQLIKVQFEFIDSLTMMDNAFFCEGGEVIDYNQIDFTDGSVFIKQSEANIGDINLNSVPFEVGDVVYFTNYFIDPGSYPLDGDRWQNSDINQDGRPGTIGDLIQLISIVGGASGSAKMATVISESYEVETTTRTTSTGTELFADSDTPIGGALIVVSFDGEEDITAEVNDDLGDVDVYQSVENGTLRVLILDADGDGIVTGSSPLLQLKHSENQRIMIEETNFADVFGRELMNSASRSVVIPKSYSLEQNFPNPFNPSTTLAFSIPSAGRVTLEVYNINGQLVRVLVDESLPAGRHEIIWDGKDGRSNPVASGIYFYRLESGAFSNTRKMTLIK